MMAQFNTHEPTVSESHTVVPCNDRELSESPSQIP